MSTLTRYLSGQPLGRNVAGGEARAAKVIGGINELAALLRTTQSKITGTEFSDFETYLEQNPITFGAFYQRMSMFKQARIQYQRMENSRPGELFGDRSLSIFENPWPGGTTDDLLATIELDVTRAGICAIRRAGDRLDVLDPHKISSVTELISDRPGAPPFAERLKAWVYEPTAGQFVVWHADELAGSLTVFRPIPDPRKRFGGMSWLRPARLDVKADDMMTRHRVKFFENAATPNLLIKSEKALTDPQYDRLKDLVDERHSGLENAYRTLILEGGADAEAIGVDMNGARLVESQDAVENRISVASGVPAPLIGVKVGVSPTYNNFETARAHFADAWARPQWRGCVGALDVLSTATPANSRLWYDDRDIPALQRSATAAAEIRGKDASTVATLITAGFTPDSANEAVAADDFTRLVHTGLVSVQLQPPGVTAGDE